MSVMEKVRETHQVRFKETSTNEPLRTCRNHTYSASKPGRAVGLGQIRRMPDYRSDGARHKDGVNLNQASLRNCRNLSPACIRENLKQRPCKRESIDGWNRDGAARSRVENPVMGSDRRSCVTQAGDSINFRIWRRNV